MSSGIRDFGVTFSSKIFILFISIGTQSCLAWVLGPGGRGSYAVCILFMTLLSLVFVIGCDYAGIYYVASKKISISEGVIYTFIFCGIGSLLAITAGLIIMQLPFSFLSKATSAEFHLSFVLIPISVFSQTVVQLFTAMRQFGWFSILTIVSGLSQFLATLAFVLVFKCGVKGALFANIVAGIIIIIISLTILNLKFQTRWMIPSLQNLIEMFFYDVRHYVGKLSSQINFQVGTIILAIFATQEEIGLFAVAITLVTRITMIPDVLGTILLPKVAADKVGRKELIAQSARLSGIISGVALLILVIFTRPIIFVLFSPAFLPTISLIRIMAIGILVRCAFKVFVPFLLGTNRPGIVSIATVFGIAVNLVLLWILFPILGITGASIAVAASFFAMSTILLVSFIRISSLGLFEILHFRCSDWSAFGEAMRQARRKFSFVSSSNS
ncbi:MAG: oligosaccharide flippase family protein [Calditrichia bacterium]|nr:oligosaccharide flippase family protein [Calditrichia bacterium]